MTRVETVWLPGDEPTSTAPPTPLPTVPVGGGIRWAQCGPCRDEQQRWVCGTTPAMFARPRMEASAMHDVSSAGVVENRRGRWNRWRDLVHRQCALIADGCARSHTIAAEPHALPSGQYELFEVAA